MALGNDTTNDGPQQPFAYVLIPLLGFGLIVSLITCYRFRRRKQRLARLVAEDPGYVRELEAGRTRVDRRGPNGAVVTGRRRAGRRLGLGVGSREEGLNELGEAPPAYTPNAPNAPKPPEAGGGGVENVELMTYSQATAEAGTSRSPPGYGEEPSSSAATGSRMGTVAGTTSGGAGDTARLSQEMRRGATGSATTSTGARETTRLSEEMRRDGATGNAGTTTEEAVADTTAAATSSTNEPAPPPRAVLPPASN
ncbi:hypothetical protein F4823DRAFT_564816 [Ustulina deusta]|nr:hypothetical protein F4823DRAFT_564816 [Ustulina deusta]